MNAFGAECSNGCESGWTLYLEQSFLSPNSSHKVEKKMRSSDSFWDNEIEKFISEEDLSMVSDASSGPPHCNEEENDTTNIKFMNNNDGIGKRKKDQRKSRRCENQEAFLDDTASSQNNFALLNNHASMEGIVDYSPQFSTTHFQGRSAYQEHFGYVQPSIWKPTSE